MTARSLSAAVCHLGSGHAPTNIGGVPWHTLGSGDTVYIHWRAQPCCEKWVISHRGAPAAPIRVLGVTNASGARPVIKG